MALLPLGLAWDVLIKRLVLGILLLALGVGVGGVLGMVFSGDPTFAFVGSGALVVIIGIIVVGSILTRATSRRRAQTSSDPAGQGPLEVPAKRAFPVVVVVLIVVVGTAVTLIPAYGSIGRAVESFAAGDFDGTSMSTGNYQQVAVDAIAEVAGGYEFVSIQFYDTYVVASGPASPGSDTMDSYIWRYGHAYRDGSELIQGEELTERLFDASTLDFAVVGQVARDVRDDFPELETVSPRVEGAGVPTIRFLSTGERGTLIYTFDGTLVEPR